MPRQTYAFNLGDSVRVRLPDGGFHEGTICAVLNSFAVRVKISEKTILSVMESEVELL